MARSGSGTHWMRTNTTAFSNTTFNAQWSMHCFVRSSVAPNNGSLRHFGAIVGAGAVPNPHCQMIWDHTNSAISRAVAQRRASNAYDIPQATTTPSADTWYAWGGSYDGTNVNIWINGVNETSTASADAASVASMVAILGLPDQTGALDSGACLTNGSVAEFAAWNTGLTAAEFAALAKGFRPPRIRPQSIQLYAPLVRETLDYRGNALTEFNTPGTVTDHPRVY